VDEHIPERRELRPVDFWMLGLEIIREALSGFGHRVEIAEDRILVKLGRQKRTLTFTGRAFDRLIISRI
jgi:hypothetical protein